MSQGIPTHTPFNTNVRAMKKDSEIMGPGNVSFSPIMHGLEVCGKRQNLKVGGLMQG